MFPIKTNPAKAAGDKIMEVYSSPDFEQNIKVR
jgi:hypothetical protein